MITAKVSTLESIKIFELLKR